MVMLFNMADLDSSGDLGKEELRGMLLDPRAREIMLAFGMNMHIPPSMLHTIVDLNGDGACTFPEFFDACMRLSGSIDSLHGVFVQHDICHCKEVLRKSLLGLEEHLLAIVPKREGWKRSSVAEAPEHEDSVAEAEITALRERLDRFAEKQKLMQAELQALKEQWQPVCREGQPFNDSPGKHLSISDSTTGDGSFSGGDASSLGASLPLPLPSSARMQPASPLAAAVKAARAPRMFLHAFGRELGVGVMDSVFGDPPQRPHSAEPWARRRPGGLRAAARRQLEAEFAAKKAAEALRHG
uniref:Calmodulin n=1 Tax=Alexandrium catenella TaxID=2925 RepID=A0A7S1RJY1_ALECA|mmetsp:Transcript_61454/g.164424  ORF Transcript_61454/g.164424 Transcript_61454/m.164424 type:complete len:298 (+) Transcript_61454:1-894(+)